MPNDSNRQEMLEVIPQNENKIEGVRKREEEKKWRCYFVYIPLFGVVLLIVALAIGLGVSISMIKGESTQLKSGLGQIKDQIEGLAEQVESIYARYWKQRKLIEGEQQIVKNTLLKKTPRGMAMEYSVRFEVKPTSFIPSKFGNVIHFTNNDTNTASIGGRLPAVWFYGSQLQVESYINDGNNVYRTSSTYSTGEWIGIEITQTNPDYLYTIKVNGKVLYSVKNESPEDFSDVKMYASNNWDTSQPGYIRKLSVYFRNNDFNKP